MAQVHLENVTKVFTGQSGERIEAVRGVSLTVDSGELLVLLGPSGSGKTTLLRLIAGLEELTGGCISIGGRVVDELAPHARDVAMVFQHYALYPHLNTFENIAFSLRLQKVPRTETARRVREASEMLGLTPHLARFPKELSGGERQRVAVARALVQKPQLFLFDEPLANLDAPMRLQMRREIAKLQRRLAVTAIYVTHDQVEAMTLGHRIAVIRQGLVQQVASPVDLYAKPDNLFVAGFIGSPPMNQFRGKLAARKPDSITFQFDSNIELAPNGSVLALDSSAASQLLPFSGRSVILGLRPEAVLVERGLEVDSAVHIAAGVEFAEPVGPHTHVHLISGDCQLTARVNPTPPPSIGEKLRCRFDLSQAHFFDAQTECRLI